MLAGVRIQFEWVKAALQFEWKDGWDWKCDFCLLSRDFGEIRKGSFFFLIHRNLTGNINFSAKLGCSGGEML